MLNASTSAVGRLSLCRDILNLRERITHAQGAQKINARVLGERRIAAIRQVLLGRATRDLVDEVLTPSLGYVALQSVMDGVREEPEVVRVRAALYAGEMIKMLRAIDAGEVRAGLSDDQQAVPPQLLEEVLMTISLTSSDHADELADAAINAGKFIDDMREQVAKAVSSTGKVSAASSLRLEDIDPELFAKSQEIQAQNDALLKVYNDLSSEYAKVHRDVFYNGKWEGRSDEAAAELQRLKDAMREAYSAYNKHYDSEIVASHKDKKVALAKARAAIDAPLVEVGRKALDSMMAQASITTEQAREWAQSQEITKTAAARLKKLGYPIEQVRADMAEFYRFTGGRVSKVKVDSKGDKRANATKIDSHGTSGAINLGSAFDKRVLWHELAHHIESDPVARMASGRLIKRRSVDGKAYSLRSLTGSKGYRSDEAAYKDHFFSEYVGKIYKDGMTEVFSMGVESFADPLTLGKRIAQDPQTLEFVAGYLKQPLDQLAKAFIKMRDNMRESNEEMAQALGDVVGDLVKELSQGVTMTTDKDSSWVTEKGWDYYIKGKQIGFFYDSTNGANWYVFSTQVRNYVTGRKMLGFGVYCPMPTGEIGTNGKPRYSLGRSEYATKDLDVVKAAYAIYRKTGAFPHVNDLNNENFLRKQVAP
jgi:hypothetical protein